MFLTYSNTINDKWEIVSGIEFENTNSIPPYANDQVLGNSAKYEGDIAATIDGSLTVKETRYSGFIQFSFKPFKKLNIFNGIRYDYSSRNGGTINPRIGLISKPFSGTTVKLLFGTAFQAPSLFLQYEQWGAEKAVMLSAEELKILDPSWHLKNQRIKTFEISLNQRFRDYLKIYLSFYHHKLNNLIERVIYTDSAYNKYFSDENNPVYSLGFRNENVGIQKIFGMNASIYAKIKENFTGYFHYSFTDAVAEKSTGDTPIPRIAADKFWLGVTFKNVFKFFTVSPRFKLFGNINNRNSKAFPNGTQPGYSNLDISVIADNLIKNIRLFVQFNNVFNADIKHGGIYDQTFLLSTSQQPGFQFFLGFEFTK
jgi:iron complex outermembrane receptor protein